MADMGRHSKSFGVVSAAPFGSSAILPISWAYIKVRNLVQVGQKYQKPNDSKADFVC
jgi:glycine cleavage system protein P-like pyridoxal-binding family